MDGTDALRGQDARLLPEHLHFGSSYKRLDRGTFRLPPVPDGTTQLAIEERVLDDLLDGVDLEPSLPKRTTTH